MVKYISRFRFHTALYISLKVSCHSVKPKTLNKIGRKTIPSQALLTPVITVLQSERPARTEEAVDPVSSKRTVESRFPQFERCMQKLLLLFSLHISTRPFVVHARLGTIPSCDKIRSLHEALNNEPSCDQAVSGIIPSMEMYTLRCRNICMAA